MKLIEFLKTYTAIDEKFINEYIKFYDLCENNNFGINVEDIIKYLKIQQKKIFYDRLRANYEVNKDFVIKQIYQKKTLGVRNIEYYVNIDTFEKICMLSKSIRANAVRDYFIVLRKFIMYYKDHIDEMIKAKITDKKSVIYILLVKKDIFKIGRTENMRKRMKQYITGKAYHPDIKYIILVDDPKDVENCVKRFMKKYKFLKR